MTTLITPERLAEILQGQRTYRTTEQLDRDIRDLLAEREQLLASVAARGKDTASRDESTSAPYRAASAEVRFAVYGSVQLLDPAVRNLPADYYGHHYRQLGGWLPDAWSGAVPRGTASLEFAHLPGLVMPTDINVQVETTTTRDGSRYMAIEWRRERP
ncbi:hypothetical protein [Streptomyces sp. WAC01280]|uniref:hypothetical protein n=1 Tax=Streptomyces sp. WAC01280 TaxID=2487424 RepID=UPI000F79EE26|nr:hypothetical protein [Streptomyces sp. WAC01280]RSS51394.1 hypothetical protein EF909_34440 [Streptomyces sp. WAC01280]